LFYGEKYGVKIESERGRYTKVLVSLPAVRIEDDAETETELNP
jgi:hypothetical protein